MALNEKEARAHIKACKKFKEYDNIEEYIEDVVVCLVYSPWNYTEESARERVRYRMNYVRYAFEHREPADDCSIEVGYSCG